MTAWGQMLSNRIGTVLVGLALALVAGCTFSPSVNTCESDDDCASLEQVCNPQGFCVNPTMEDRDLVADVTTPDVSDGDTSMPPVGCGESPDPCAGATVCCASAGGDCPPGDPDCFCVDPQADRENCGACGNRCGDTQLCFNGSCQCSAGLAACDDDDVCDDDTLTSGANCGGCKVACTGGNQSCTDGACLCDGRKCAMGQACCPGPGGPDAPICVDTDTSFDHCGACGKTCGEGETCVGGQCVCGATSSADGPACGGVGDICCADQCVPPDDNLCECGGTMPPTFCAAGERCCSDVCTGIRMDDMNCGACGNACMAPETCIGGTCQCPSDTPELCDADGGGKVCVDTTTDELHCGACGVDCEVGQTCCGGTCRDLQTNASHCGACGIVCSVGQVCIGGSCGCPSGTLNDDSNCGSCGTVCNGGKVCGDSGGGVFACACPAGLTDCSGNCVDTQMSLNHCGGCGQVCNASNGAPSCQSGTCVAMCNANRADCDGSPSSCETDLTTDQNCGACGNDCGDQQCVDNMGTWSCSVPCPANYLDCDGNPGNGCETPMRQTGSCGNSCNTIVDCGDEGDEGCNSNGTCDCRTSSNSNCAIVGESCESSSGPDECFCGGDGASLQCGSGQICIHDGPPNNPNNFRCVNP